MSIIQSKLTIATDDEVLQAIAVAITSIQQQSGYGSIEITVHDGRVTQIERREKVRLTAHQPNKSLTVKTAAK
jgi:hypothetical protein